MGERTIHERKLSQEKARLIYIRDQLNQCIENIIILETKLIQERGNQ